LAPERAAQAANDPVPLDKKKGTCKHASKQVLAAEPGPSATVDKKVKPDVPEATDATPAQGMCCPIHETNTHDLKTCRTIYDLAENRKKCFAECIAAGTIGKCYSCV
jgi:hypothetical protein